MFKYFNPLWLIQNLLQPSINPITIGAGVGAVGAAVTGKSPIKGALLGGATGGLFGGKESLFGDKLGGLFSGAAENVAPGVQALGGPIPSVGINTFGNNAMLADALPYDQLAGSANNLYGSWNIGQGALPATTTSGAYAGGIPLSSSDLAGGIGNAPLGSMNKSTLFNYTPPTAMDKVTGLGSDVKNWVTENPMPALSTGMNVATSLNPPPQAQPSQPAIPPVTRGTYNASPNLGMGQGPSNKVSTKIQFTPEQLKLYESFYRGGY
jgi:hypothetical protein